LIHTYMTQGTIRLSAAASAAVRDVLATPIAEQSRVCWGCGKEPPPGIKFQRCMRCAELKLPSTHFCGEACMLANWPRHKKHHKQQKVIADVRMTEHGCHEAELADEIARLADESGDAFRKMLADGIALSAKRDYQGAARVYRKTIKEWPHHPDTYFNLGGVLLLSNMPEEAAPLFVKCAELWTACGAEGTAGWANAITCAWDLLWRDECCEVPKPDWWNDEDLKVISARAVAVTPDARMYACTMRGSVLAGTLRDLAPLELLKAQPWARPRTAEEIKEAAIWFRRAVATFQSNGAKYLAEQRSREEERANICDEIADVMLVEAEAEAKAKAEARAKMRAAVETKVATARAAAEADAKEAREAAEGKAAAAAEELLAKEEEEEEEKKKKKEQAAAENKVGKANGKGKPGKGKGKRS